jgi:hypothetical protein
MSINLSSMNKLQKNVDREAKKAIRKQLKVTKTPKVIKTKKPVSSLGWREFLKTKKQKKKESYTNYLKRVSKPYQSQKLVKQKKPKKDANVWHAFLKKFKTRKDQEELDYKDIVSNAGKIWRFGNKQTKETIKVSNGSEKLANGDITGAYDMVNKRNTFTNKDLRNLKKILDKKILDNNKPLMEITTMKGDIRTLTVSNTSWPLIRDLLKKFYWEQKLNVSGSEAIDQIMFHGIRSIKFKFLSDMMKGLNVKLFNNKAGKFFKYINTTSIPLQRYQINTDEKNWLLNGIVQQRKFNTTHCLIHTLELHGVSEVDINTIRLAFKTGSHFPRSKLIDVANIIKKTIVLHSYSNDSNKQIKINKKKIGKYDESIDIAIFEDHFFIFEKTDYTTYSSKNYKDIKDIKNFKNIIKKKKGKYEKSSNNKYKCNSLQLISNLFKDGNFESNSSLLSYYDKYQSVNKDNLKIPLDRLWEEQGVKEDYDDTNDKTYDVFYADTESFVNKKYTSHQGFMMGIMKSTDTEVQINTIDKDQEWFTNSMWYVYNNSGKYPIVYFHNLKYDYNLLKKYAHVTSNCEKDGAIYETKIMFGPKGSKKTILIRDSYKLINIALAKFQSTFGLSKDMCKKEALGYTYYTRENLNNFCVPVTKYLKHIKKADKDTFNVNVMLKNKDDEYLFDYDETNKTFDPIKYYRYYLKYDVLVLKEGLEVYKQKIYELTKLDLNKSLTISSLTNKYMHKNGAFKDVFEVKGNLREYLSQAVTGGRVSVLPESRGKIIKKQLEDYDACSLYPSAISRMCKEIGVPTGKCTRVKQNKKITLKYLNKFRYFVVTINITKINKKQQLPFIHKREKGKSTQYINEVPEEGMMTIIDKFTLEDYIKFHDIEYEIIDGVYWNDGTNKTMGLLIDNLYNERLKEKKLMKDFKVSDPDKSSGHDCMQGLIKLMLNSAYGKTIIKKSNIEKIIIANGENNKKLYAYINNNFNTIKEIKKLNEWQSEIIREKFDDSFNLAIIGVMTLSMSKRIMNEVMDVANDNDIKIYYQDTDSMHIERDQVKLLESKYLETYDKVLQGSNMGNFHGDFDMKGACSDIYSVQSVFMGKKFYYDKLESKDKDGNIFHDYHVRMKGITKEGIEHSKNKKIYGSYEAIFDRLIQGKKIKFLLNPKDKCMFEFNSQGVCTRGKFIRTVKF